MNVSREPLILESRLVNETCAITLVQAGTQANQFVSAIDQAGNITHYWKSCRQKFFFLKTKKSLVLKSLCIIRQVKSWIVQNNLLLLFVCKIHVIYCKVLKVFNFKLFSYFFLIFLMWCQKLCARLYVIN